MIKGAKGASFMQPEWISWIGANTTELLLGCFAILTVLFQALIMALRINIFPIIILAGTFSLAFAFAGNDLVNFIGVPLAALSSYEIWSRAPIRRPSRWRACAITKARRPISCLPPAS